MRLPACQPGAPSLLKGVGVTSTTQKGAVNTMSNTHPTPHELATYLDQRGKLLAQYGEAAWTARLTIGLQTLVLDAQRCYAQLARMERQVAALWWQEHQERQCPGKEQ